MAMLAASIPALGSATAGAQTTTPPVPSPASGVLVFEEDFDSASPEQSIATFTGVANGYTADPRWADNSRCNGILLSRNDSESFGSCPAEVTEELGLIAEALGGGDSDNVALSAYTTGDGSAPDPVQLRSNPITVANERFYYSTVDAGAQNCFSNSPQYQFFVEDGSGTRLTLTDIFAACDNWDGERGSIALGTIEAQAAFRWDLGTSLSVGINNLEQSQRGNDAAIDNIRLIDVTPQLHKSFAETTISNGQSTNLVFTMVNTDELYEKAGISFTDDMVNLTVVDGAIGGTCSNVTGTAAGTQIDITSADIAVGEASCTIEVEVVPTNGPGIYENGTGEVSEFSFINGLTGPAILEVIPTAPVVEAHLSIGNAVGDDVAIDVLANASDLEDDIDPTTVAIVDSAYDPSTGTLVVPGEGTWTVDPATGAITFAPEAGFEDDPTPISYTVMDEAGNTSEPATVTVDYSAAVNDESLGNTPGDPVIVDVLSNDGDIDPTTVMVLDADGNPVTEYVVDGEGTWTVDPASGAITFTPEPGFIGNPTPISYIATDDAGSGVTAEVVVGYSPEGAPDESLGNIPGTTVTIDVLGNDPAPNLDPTTVMILDADGNPSTTLEVPGQGTWSVDPVSGAVTFTPEAGFTGDPTPISYNVADDLGQTTPAVAVIVDYLPVPPASPDESLGNAIGAAATIDVLANDGNIDPTTVMVLDADGNPVTELVVDGEGTWSVHPATGAITFTPASGFRGNPTPIEYIATDVLGVEISPQSVTVTYVDPAVPTLAFTGVESGHLAMLAFLLLAAGGIIVQSTNRREEDELTV